VDNGYNPTHGFAIDQTPELIEEWYSAPKVEYLLASTCHPHLVEYLLDHDRAVRFFHNYVAIDMPDVIMCECGHDAAQHDPTCAACDCTEYEEVILPYEDWLYVLLYSQTVRVGSGLNSVTRAIDLANFYLADKITVLGADCALRTKSPKPADAYPGSEARRKWLREEVIMHADGGNALAANASELTLGGYIDGRWWETKPDLVISAVFLVKMAEKYPHLRLIGDTLPNALRDKPSDFLSQLPKLVDSRGNELEYEITEIQDYTEMLTL
jgi:hypothetical protein